MCLHRVPLLVIPLHWTVALVPEVILFPGSEILRVDTGLQILQAVNPLSKAEVRSVLLEVFFTILQFSVWYFFPLGV